MGRITQQFIAEHASDLTPGKRPQDLDLPAPIGDVAGLTFVAPPPEPEAIEAWRKWFRDLGSPDMRPDRGDDDE